MTGGRERNRCEVEEDEEKGGEKRAKYNAEGREVTDITPESSDSSNKNKLAG